MVMDLRFPMHTMLFILQKHNILRKPEFSFSLIRYELRLSQIIKNEYI